MPGTSSIQLATFPGLIEKVQSCRCCPRMEGRTRVLGPENGPVPAHVMFVAEAPGRLGAELTRTPLCGDQSGRNFQELLDSAGLDRSHIFVTNAVLCNPRSTRGKNATPSAHEVECCSAHLRATIELVQPGFVVALGHTALKALGKVAPHHLCLPQNVAQPTPWRHGILVALYHPASRAMIHRSMAKQADDYRMLADLARYNGANLCEIQEYRRRE